MLWTSDRSGRRAGSVGSASLDHRILTLNVLTCLAQALRFNVYDEAGLLHDVPSFLACGG